VEKVSEGLVEFSAMSCVLEIDLDINYMIE
jgi:hypothetical protein